MLSLADASGTRLLAEVTILVLATWRIGNLVQYERGPYRLFQRMRERLGIRHNDDAEPIAWPDTELGLLLRCPDCTSVWIGIGLVGLYLASSQLALILALPFALSAGAIVVARATR